MTETEDNIEQAEDEAPAVPAPDPVEQPAGQMLTPPELFLSNFVQIFATFKAMAGAQTVKPQQTTELLTEAAKYAAMFTQTQISLIVQGVAK